MTGSVYLFPDTNIFMQCLSLDQLDWTGWQEFDVVNLIVCRTVQSEIDAHKSKGGDRVARRARSTSGLFHKLIKSDKDYEVIKTGKPEIRLYLDVHTRPTKMHEDVLDLETNDDRIVATAYQYHIQNSSFDVRLLTDDTGPMVSARAIKLPIAPVPPHWLRPPEQSEADRRIKQLESEVSKLKQQEPNVVIDVSGNSEASGDHLVFETVRYSAMSDNQIERLVKMVSDQFPRVTDFGEKHHQRRPLSVHAVSFGQFEVFIPVKEIAITRYNEKYEKWVEECRNVFVSLHDDLESLQPPMIVCVSAKNAGSRPATDALLEVQALGELWLLPLKVSRSQNEESAEQMSSVDLPKPPRPPTGKWVPELLSLSTSTLFDRDETDAMPLPWANLPSIGRFSDQTQIREEDRFYYKPQRPRSLVKNYVLECRRWRHNSGEEVFRAAIKPNGSAGKISGSLKCVFAAGNLTDVVEKVKPVRMSVNERNTEEYALRMISRMR